MANVQEIPELDPNMFVVKRGKFWVILVIFIFISKYVLLTGHRSLKTENQSQLGYSRKNKQTGLRIWDSLGNRRNAIQDFQGLIVIKKGVNFQLTEESRRIYRGLVGLGIFSKFCGISWGEALFSVWFRISIGKVRNLARNFRVYFSKKDVCKIETLAS